MPARSRFVSSRGYFPSAATILLPLVLVFLSSGTYQQVAAVQPGNGFNALLEHLVVASHHESLRVPSEKQITGSDGENGPDSPDGWFDHSIDRLSQKGWQAFHVLVATCLASHPRFLTPPLRAPPLM